MRKSLISAGRMQSMIITSARACTSGVLDTSYKSTLFLTDSNEKWSEKLIPSFSRWTLCSFWILLDAQVVFSSNVAEIIFSGALSFRNSLRSLLRRDVVATELGGVTVKALAIAFTSFSPRLSQTICWAILSMVSPSGMMSDTWHILTSPASSPPSLGLLDFYFDKFSDRGLIQMPALC